MVEHLRSFAAPARTTGLVLNACTFVVGTRSDATVYDAATAVTVPKPLGTVGSIRPSSMTSRQTQLSQRWSY